MSDLQVYTDGSAPEGLAGFGALVQAPEGGRTIYTVSNEIGKTTNNVAELEAIHEVLCWLVSNMRIHDEVIPNRHIRLFTDSQYSRNVLLSQRPSRHHFYLEESCKALAAKLRYDYSAPVSLHWLPSHIEQTSRGWLPIQGNREADRLAEEARKRCTAESTSRQTSIKRCKLQSSISSSLANIEAVFNTTEEPKPQNGPSPDDFDLDASQELSSVSCDT